MTKHCAICGRIGHNRTSCNRRPYLLDKAPSAGRCTICGERHGCLTCGRGTLPRWKCEVCNGQFPTEDAPEAVLAAHQAANERTPPPRA